MNQSFDPQDNAGPDPEERTPSFEEIAADIRRSIGSRLALEWELSEQFAANGFKSVNTGSEQRMRRTLVEFVETQLANPRPQVVYKSDVPLLYQDQQTGEVHFFLDIAAIDVKRFLLPGSPTDPFLQADDQIVVADAAKRALNMPRYMYLDHALGVVGKASGESSWSSVNSFDQKSVRLRAVFSAAAVQAMMGDLTKLEEEFHTQREGSNYLSVFKPSFSSYILGALFHAVESNVNGLIMGWRDFQVNGGESLDFSLTVLPEFSPGRSGPIPNFAPVLDEEFLTTVLRGQQDVHQYTARPRAVEGGYIDFALERVA